MIITSCVIPIIVFIVLIWGSKIIFNLNYDFSNIKNIYAKRNIKAIRFKKDKKE